MKIFRSINSVIEKIEHCLVVVSLSLMVVLTFINVLLRSLYTHAYIQWANNLLGQVDWTEPFARLMVLWITFLGASLLTGENRHIKIDILPSLMSKGWLSVREVVLSVCCVLVCALMLKASINYIYMEMDFGSRLLLGIPSWICQSIIPIGFSVMLFRFFLRALDQLLSMAGDASS